MSQTAHLQPAPLGLKLAGMLVKPLAEDAEITIRTGDLALRLGQRTGRKFTLVLDKPATIWHMLRNPDPSIGEAYMRGEWELEEGDIGAFLTMLARGRQKLVDVPGGGILFYLMNKRPADYDHDPAHSRKQVQYHYDMGNDLYEAFLDGGMNYSCAFFDRPGMSLRDAQVNKIRTSIDRLDIGPGMRVLDIGCGWGETARMIAEETEAAEVNGITLAENQLMLARERAARMRRPPSFFLQDYREHAATRENHYHRIISVGMFEHVGTERWDDYFAAIHRQLKPGGKALIHSIIRSGEPSTHELSSTWLDRYIFPGGCLGELEDMIEIGERNGLVLDHAPYIHQSRHYAETLRHWRKNFMQNFGHLNHGKYDERFRRMWIFYLAMCEAMFDGCGYRVTQLRFRKASP
jgi:cyclopropane-fatty-acyl-phospholipid synthase